MNNLFASISETKHLKLKGIHAHIGSQIFELDPHKDLGEIMVNVILDAKKFGHDIQKLNVGGGLGIKYTEHDDPPSIDEWVKTISKSVFKACKKHNLDLPTLSSLILWPYFLESKITFTIISPRSLCGSSSKIWEPI